jgi:plasmid stability protein
MASLMVRNIPEDAKQRFRQIAAAHGRSMEDHLRQLVISAAFDDEPTFAGVRDVSHSFRHFEPDQKAQSRARIERLIALGRGLNFEAPPREYGELRDIDFS